MLPSFASFYCITGVTDMSASPYIVGMQYVYPYYLASLTIHCHACITLPHEEIVGGLLSQLFILRKCYALSHYFIPYIHCLSLVLALIFPYCYHFSFFT